MLTPSIYPLESVKTLNIYLRLPPKACAHFA